MAGYTRSTDFPTTPGVFQTTSRGAADAFVVKLVPGDQVWPLSLNLGNETVGFPSAVVRHN